MLTAIGHALGAAAAMAWDVGWSLVLGFALSAIVQAIVSKGEMQAVLGRDGPREIALATVFGAASSSCSYAAAAMSKTLFAGGAGFASSLAFLFASTNLVVELAIVLWLLLGWQFAAAEWIGGVLLVVIMALLVRLTGGRDFVEAARAHVRRVQAGGHNHGSMEGEGSSPLSRLRSRATWIAVAQNFAMDVSMLWKDLVAGFLIAGALAAFVPANVWQTVFLAHAPAWLRVPVDALTGPLVAVVTFVCSIGNIPMAAVLWGGGVSFGGVLAFIYADLLVLPLLDVYRRYYGWRMAAYMATVFYVTMALAAIAVDGLFAALHLAPAVRGGMPLERLAAPAFDVTTLLNVLAIGGAIVLFAVDARNPMQHHHGAHHAEMEH